MPQYNIELRTADRVWDTFALERDDVSALRGEVSAFVGEMLKDHASKIWADQEWRVDVTDANGLIMFVLHLFVTDSPALNPPRR